MQCARWSYTSATCYKGTVIDILSHPTCSHLNLCVAEYKFHVLHFFKSKTPEIKWLKIKHHFLGFFRVYCFSSVSEMNSSQTNQDWQVKYSDYIINNYTKLIKRLASLFYSNACLKFVSFKTVRLLWRKLIPSVLLNCPFIYVY